MVTEKKIRSAIDAVFHHTHHLQHISRNHLHTAHGSSESAHDGGYDIKGTYAEQQLLWERREEKETVRAAEGEEEEWRK